MYYVTTTDKFMSGWGPASGKINKLVILCETAEEADTVVENAENRSDQKHVSCSSEPPPYFHKRWEETGADYETGNYYVQVKTKADMPAWFEPGAFGGSS